MYVFGGNSPTYNVDKHHGIWRFLWGVSNSHIWGRFPWPWTELNYWVWNHYIELWKIGFNKPLDLKSSKQAIGRNHPCRNSPFVLHFISQIRVIPISQSHLVVVHGGKKHYITEVATVHPNLHHVDGRHSDISVGYLVMLWAYDTKQPFHGVHTYKYI